MYKTRLLSNGDNSIVQSFLTPRTAEAYYMLSNIFQKGMDDYKGENFEAYYWGAFSSDKLVGMASYSWRRSIQILVDDAASLPHLAQAITPQILESQQANPALCAVEAFIGPSREVHCFLDSFSLRPEDFRINNDFLLFKLEMKDLTLPSPIEGATLRHATEKDEAVLVQSRMDFNVESLAAEPDDAMREGVVREVREKLLLNQLYLLEKEGQIVASCNVNGFLPQGVMVGFVWTPPELRGRGYAKALTSRALQLAFQEKPSLQEAYLVAIRPDAIRVYESIGFKKVCDWRLAFPKEDYRFG